MSFLKSVLVGVLFGVVYVGILYVLLPLSLSISSVPLLGIFFSKIVLVLLGGLYAPLSILESIFESYTMAWYEVLYVSIILGVISAFLYRSLSSKGVTWKKIATLLFILAISVILYFIGIVTGNANDVSDLGISDDSLETRIQIPE